ncbi:subclass B3 metallo-beta-lactamase [Dokdonella sp.]|uniref:subclass B3 metallo-beta-lactamase n=1 Tax=Dokdonella sp. TaxID=2291710 RepID=UPI003C5D9189
MRLAACLSSTILILATPGLAAASSEASPSTCSSDSGWNDTARPAHIYGNTWYVGTCGISAILITTPGGHVLLDGATEKAAPMIEANIRALGFKVSDIRFIVSSHEHFDHVGGLAALQRESGAVVVAREPAASSLERGESEAADPQFGSLRPFPPVDDVRRIRNGESLALGGLTLTAHATPGHTSGSTSWTWTSCEAQICQDMAYADSLTAISSDAYLFSDEAKHPGSLAAFRQSLEIVASLPCDILMTPHPGASGMFERLGPAARESLIDPSACKRYSEKAGQRLDARLEKEKAAARP